MYRAHQEGDFDSAIVGLSPTVAYRGFVLLHTIKVN